MARIQTVADGTLAVGIKDLEIPAIAPAFESSSSIAEVPVRGRRDRALDGLRGVAILAVMLFHFTAFERSTQILGKLTLRLCSFGWVGVDLFFALSGFLITGILLDAKGKPNFFRNFYARRALRIFPLYYAVLMAAMIAVRCTWSLCGEATREVFRRQFWLWTYSANIEDAIKSDWVYNGGHLWLNHLWSLAVEEQFYLVWPVLVLLLSQRRLAAVSVGIIGVAPILRAALVAHGVTATIVYSLTPCRVDTLAFGSLAAVLARDAPLRARIAPVLPMIVVASLGTLGLVIWARRGLYFLDPVVDVVAFSPLAALFAAALLQLSLVRRSFSRSVLESSTLVFFGKYSYAAYLLHYIMWPFLEQMCPASRLIAATGSESLGLFAHAAVGVLVTTGAAVASFHLFERRFLELKSKF